MNSKFLLLLTCLLLIQYNQLLSQCTNNSNIFNFSFNGKSYEVVKDKKSWSDAASCAVERGGYLVEINDSAEQLAVYNAIISAGVSSTYTNIANGGGIAYVWIGATDQANEGTWLWNGNNDSSGLNFWTGQGSSGSGNGARVNGRFNNWGGKSTGTIKEPDNYGSVQHFAAMALAGWPSGTTSLGIAGEWNDIIGSSLLYFIVEKNSGTGIRNTNFLPEIKITPNPCQEKLIIDTRMVSGMSSIVNGNNSFEIFELSGKLICKDILPETKEINIKELNPGVYYLKLTDEQSINIIKFIKN